jgi:hypothetical protein
MYCDKRSNFKMKFVFLRRIIKTKTGLKMVVGVGFCKIKVDSNFLLVLKIKCTKFHQDRSKTVELHTKYTNKQTFSFMYID